MQSMDLTLARVMLDGQASKRPIEKTGRLVESNAGGLEQRRSVIQT